MGELKDGERLAALETEVKNIQNSQESMTKSVEALHGKFDTFQQLIVTNYVSKDTFDEYKKNRWLERIITIIVTASITGLVGFFIAKAV